jgi:hypothetical protein
MKSSVLFKISSVLLAFFGITHTFGLFRARTEAGASAVVESMRTVHFDIMGFNRCFWDFYIGFGLLATVFLLFSAVLAWQLGCFVKEYPKVVRNIAWPFVVAQIGVAALSWNNFFLPPAITSTVIVVCLFAAAWQSGKVAR